MREVAERLLGAQRAALVVHVLQLDAGPEVLLLAEVLQRAGLAALATPVLVVLPARADRAGLRVKLSFHTNQ